jgi:hypothetical protein
MDTEQPESRFASPEGFGEEKQDLLLKPKPEL